MTARDAWRIERAGSLDRLRRVTEPIGPPAPGEVRVAVKAIGLNFADIFACLGLYSATPGGAFVPGLELAGVVDDPGTTPLARGARVIGLTRFGAYTTAINVDHRYVRPLPAAWSFEEGAAFLVQALTAWYGLVRLARVASGEVVLVHSAAGGVGLHALEILRAAGARALATVGRAGKREFLAAHTGLDPALIVVRDRRRFGEQLDAALGAANSRGFDVVFDAVAGPYFWPAYTRLRPEGRHVIYGAADFMTTATRPDYLRLLPRYLRRPRLDPVRMIAENRSVLGFNLIWLWSEVDRLAAACDALEGLCATPPLVGRTFPFSEVPAAMRWLQGGESVAKVVVTT